MANTVADIAKFFGTEEKPVSASEFGAFWSSLSAEEKDEIRLATLS